MAIFFSSSGQGISGWVLYLKVLITSATVLSMAVLVKTSAPVITDFVVSEVPSAYAFLLSWLRPPYLYVLINCIIISIVASSKLHHKVEEAPAPLVPPASPPVESFKAGGDVLAVEYTSHGGISGNWSGDFNDERPGKLEDVLVGVEEGESEGGAKEVNDAAAEVLRPVKLPERNDSTDFSFLNLNEKRKKLPPVPARFPRKSVKSSSSEAGRALGVSKPKRQDTLESTWKAITDGRAMPLTRHLRKSDTWDNRLRRNDENTPPAPAPRMKKSETFSDGSNAAAAGENRTLSPLPAGSGKLRREPSLGQDELNRRVEAFIKKFNEEMRLQRQESLNQYQEMIRRGAV